MADKDERRKRLPVWGQNLIAKLEADVKYYRKRAEGVEGKASRIWMGWMEPDRRYLPEDVVTFRTGDDRHSDITVRLTEDGTVSIGTYSGRIEVLPTSSNQIEVRPGRL